MMDKETKNTHLTRASENYLEAILMVQNDKGFVRSVDLAEKLNVSKPSVSRAVHVLRDAGMLSVSPDHILRLTDAGREAAERIYEKHRFFTAALVCLGVDRAQAEADACEMEHVVSDRAFSIIKRHCASTGPETAPAAT